MAYKSASSRRNSLRKLDELSGSCVCLTGGSFTPHAADLDMSEHNEGKLTLDMSDGDPRARVLRDGDPRARICARDIGLNTHSGAVWWSLD